MQSAGTTFFMVARLVYPKVMTTRNQGHGGTLILGFVFCSDEGLTDSLNAEFPGRFLGNFGYRTVRKSVGHEIEQYENEIDTDYRCCAFCRQRVRTG